MTRPRNPPPATLPSLSPRGNRFTNRVFGGVGHGQRIDVSGASMAGISVPRYSPASYAEEASLRPVELPLSRAHYRRAHLQSFDARTSIWVPDHVTSLELGDFLLDLALKAPPDEACCATCRTPLTGPEAYWRR